MGLKITVVYNTMINATFYNPKPEVSFLTLRTNTQIFAPHKELYKLPEISMDQNQPNAFHVPTPIPTPEEEIDRMVQEQIMLRNGPIQHQLNADKNFPRRVGNLRQAVPTPKFGDPGETLETR